ncbi:hypothetical protein FACS189454_06580 [Planctomycetales bacterium]|nr:hypothetical protein FACS189454_06580 [Planctomycetales bacterium]
MIETYTAITLEADDPEIAVGEILEQLNFGKNARKNSAAIIHCATDFIDTGVYQAVCKALPCRTIGVTTLGFAVHDSVSEIALTVMLLTGDDFEFAIGLTDPITEADENIIKRIYDETAAKMTDTPKLALSYFPLKTLSVGAGGDFIIQSMNKIAAGVPVFGTMPIDNTHDFRDARILLDGGCYDDRFAFMLVGGKSFAPRFYLGSVSKSQIRSQPAMVTKSDGNFLYEINNTPVVDYLKKDLKIEFNERDAAMVHLIPLLIDLNDGMPAMARAINEITEDNVGVCSANIPVGASVQVSRFGPSVVIEATNETLENLLKKERNAGGILIYSCAARYWALGLDTTIEMDLVEKIMEPERLPYMLGYSCGELCPLQNETGELANRFHNYTIIVCVW